MFVLKAAPTFRAKVEIPVPGEGGRSIDFVFRHKRRSELKLFIGEATGRDDIDVLTEVIADWSGVADCDGVAVAYSVEALSSLIDLCPGAGAAILAGYIKELVEGRTKN